MLRSGSSIFAKSPSARLSHSGSGRLSVNLRPRGKETRKYGLKIYVDTLDAASIQGDVVICLDKTDGPMPCTTPVSTVNDGGSHTPVRQMLVGDVTLVCSKGGQFKPKLVKVVIKLSSISGPTITSTYVNVTDYEGIGQPGKRLRIQMENGSSVFGTLSCQALSECAGLESASPTSVMGSEPTRSARRSMNLQGSSSGFLKGKLMKAFGSKRGLSGSAFNQTGADGSQCASENATPLQELQTENSRLYKLITVTKEGTSTLAQVRTENEALKKEMLSLKENSVPSREYDELVRELCKVREARAAAELDKQTLEHRLKMLNERQRPKQRKSRWR